jgi:hypothetical protein
MQLYLVLSGFLHCNDCLGRICLAGQRHGTSPGASHAQPVTEPTTTPHWWSDGLVVSPSQAPRAAAFPLLGCHLSCPPE